MAMPAQGNMAMLARLLMGQKNGMPPQMQQPFMGLGGLPPFEQPGSSLPAERYISTPQAPQPGPGPSPTPPAMAQAPQAPQAPQPGMPDPAAMPPQDATTVPPMPPSAMVGGDPQAALRKQLEDQFAQMFPQFAGGSLTQLRGGG